MSQPNSFPLNSDESLVDRAKRLFVEFGHTPLIIAGAIVGLVLVVFFVWSQQAWMADAVLRAGWVAVQAWMAARIAETPEARHFLASARAQLALHVAVADGPVASPAA